MTYFLMDCIFASPTGLAECSIRCMGFFTHARMQALPPPIASFPGSTQNDPNNKLSESPIAAESGDVRGGPESSSYSYLRGAAHYISFGFISKTPVENTKEEAETPASTINDENVLPQHGVNTQNNDNDDFSNRSTLFSKGVSDSHGLSNCDAVSVFHDIHGRPCDGGEELRIHSDHIASLTSDNAVSHDRSEFVGNLDCQVSTSKSIGDYRFNEARPGVGSVDIVECLDKPQSQRSKHRARIRRRNLEKRKKKYSFFSPDREKFFITGGYPYHQDGRFYNPDLPESVPMCNAFGAVIPPVEYEELLGSDFSLCVSDDSQPFVCRAVDRLLKNTENELILLPNVQVGRLVIKSSSNGTKHSMYLDSSLVAEFYGQLFPFEYRPLVDLCMNEENCDVDFNDKYERSDFVVDDVVKSKSELIDMYEQCFNIEEMDSMSIFDGAVSAWRAEGFSSEYSEPNSFVSTSCSILGFQENKHIMDKRAPRTFESNYRILQDDEGLPFLVKGPKSKVTVFSSKLLRLLSIYQPYWANRKEKAIMRDESVFVCSFFQCYARGVSSALFLLECFDDFEGDGSVFNVARDAANMVAASNARVNIIQENKFGCSKGLVLLMFAGLFQTTLALPAHPQKSIDWCSMLANMILSVVLVFMFHNSLKKSETSKLDKAFKFAQQFVDLEANADEGKKLEKATKKELARYKRQLEDSDDESYESATDSESSYHDVNEETRIVRGEKRRQKPVVETVLSDSDSDQNEKKKKAKAKKQQKKKTIRFNVDDFQHEPGQERLAVMLNQLHENIEKAELKGDDVQSVRNYMIETNAAYAVTDNFVAHSIDANVREFRQSCMAIEREQAQLNQRVTYNGKKLEDCSLAEQFVDQCLSVPTLYNIFSSSTGKKYIEIMKVVVFWMLQGHACYFMQGPNANSQRAKLISSWGFLLSSTVGGDWCGNMPLQWELEANSAGDEPEDITLMSIGKAMLQGDLAKNVWSFFSSLVASQVFKKFFTSKDQYLQVCKFLRETSECTNIVVGLSNMLSACVRTYGYLKNGMRWTEALCVQDTADVKYVDMTNVMAGIESVPDDQLQNVARSLDELRDTYTYRMKNAESDALKHFASIRLTQVLRWKKKWLSLFKLGKTKPPPFVVTFYGAAGIGKSTCTENVQTLLHHWRSKLIGPIVKNVGMVNAEDKYDSTLSSLTTGIVFDDLGSTKPFQGDPNGIPASRLLRYVGSTYSDFTRAEVDGKGVEINMAEFVVINTNIETAYCEFNVTQPQAGLRRLGLCFEVQVLDEYKDGLDYREFPDPQGGLPIHWRYMPYKFVQGKRVNLSEYWMTPQGALHALQMQYKAHVDAQKMITNYAPAVFCPSCSNPIGNGCVCNGCNVYTSMESAIAAKPFPWLRKGVVLQANADEDEEEDEDSYFTAELEQEEGLKQKDKKKIASLNSAIEAAKWMYRLEDWGIMHWFFPWVMPVEMARMRFSNTFFGKTKYMIAKNIGRLTYYLVGWWWPFKMDYRDQLEDAPSELIMFALKGCFGGMILAYLMRGFLDYKTSVQATVSNIFQANMRAPHEPLSVDDRVSMMKEKKHWQATSVHKLDKTDNQRSHGLTDSLVKKLHSNCGKLYKLKGDEWDQVSHYFFLKTGFLLLPSHIWRPHEKHLGLKFAFFVDGEWFYTQAVVHRSATMFWPDSDLCCCYTPTLLGCRPSFVNYLTDAEIKMPPKVPAPEGSVVKYIQPSGKTLKYLARLGPDAAFNTTRINSIEDVSYGTSLGLNEMFHCKGALMVDCVFEGGDCMLPIFDGDDRNCVLIGFHICASKVTSGVRQAGFARFTRKMFDEAEEFFLDVPGTLNTTTKTHILSVKGKEREVSENVHKKNPVKFIPAECATIPIELKGDLGKDSTYVTKTEFHPYKLTFETAFKLPDMRPVKMNNQPFRDVLSFTIEPTATMQRAPLEAAISEVEEIMFDAVDAILELEKSSEEFAKTNNSCGIMTINEVVNGALDVPGATCLKLDTSAGEPFRCTKDKLIEGTYPNRRFIPEVLDAIERAEEDIRNGNYSGSVGKMTLKDEARKASKADEARVFTCTSLPQLILCMKYAGKLVDGLTRVPDKTGFAMGVSSHGKSWHIVIAETLDRHKCGDGNSCFDLDFKKWDQTLPNEVRLAAAKILARSICRLKGSKDDQKFIENLFFEFMSPLCSINGALIELPGLWLSGVYLTALLGSLCGKLLLAYTWHCDPFLTERKCFGNIASAHLGDDNTGSSSEPNFNQETIARVMHSVGMKATAGNKTEINAPFTDPKQISFLKRKTMWCPWRKYCIGALEPSSIFKPLTCMMRSSNVTLDDQTTQQCDSVCMEALQWGRLSYERVRTNMIWCLNKIGVPPSHLMLMGFEERMTHHYGPPACDEEAYPNLGFEAIPDGETELTELCKLILEANANETLTQFDTPNGMVQNQDFKDAFPSTPFSPGSGTLSYDRSFPVLTTSIGMGLSYTTELRCLDVFTDPYLQSRWRNVNGVKFNLQYRFTLSGSQGHAGKMIISSFPMKERLDFQQESSYPADILETVYTNRSHVILGVGENDSEAFLNVPIVIPIPFLSVADLLDTDLSPYLNISTLVSFSHSLGNADPVVLNVFVQIVDLEHSGPTALVANADEKPSATMDSVGDALLSAGQLFRGLPTLSLASEVAGNLVKGGASLARMYGFSKPLDFSNNASLVNTAPPLAASDLNMPGRTLSLFSNQEVAIGNLDRSHGADQLTHEFLLNIKPIVASFEWSSTQSSGTTLAIMGVTPFMLRRNGDLIAMSTSALVASNYAWWHGAMEYEIEVVCPNQYGGKLMIFHEPDSRAGIETLSTTTNPSYIMDLKKSKVVSLRVGWTVNHYALRTTHRQLLDFRNGHEEGFTNGCLYFIVQSGLMTMSTGVVDVKVIVRARADERMLFFDAYNCFSLLEVDGISSVTTRDVTNIPIGPQNNLTFGGINVPPDLVRGPAPNVEPIDLPPAPPVNLLQNRTRKPSKMPTQKPSKVPSKRPTKMPSSLTTRVPSSAPTALNCKVSLKVADPLFMTSPDAVHSASGGQYIVTFPIAGSTNPGYLTTICCPTSDAVVKITTSVSISIGVVVGGVWQSRLTGTNLTIPTAWFTSSLNGKVIKLSIRYVSTATFVVTSVQLPCYNLMSPIVDSALTINAYSGGNPSTLQSAAVPGGGTATYLAFANMGNSSSTGSGFPITIPSERDCFGVTGAMIVGYGTLKAGGLNRYGIPAIFVSSDYITIDNSDLAGKVFAICRFGVVTSSAPTGVPVLPPSTMKPTSGDGVYCPISNKPMGTRHMHFGDCVPVAVSGRLDQEYVASPGSEYRLIKVFMAYVPDIAVGYGLQIVFNTTAPITIGSIATGSFVQQYPTGTYQNASLENFMTKRTGWNDNRFGSFQQFNIAYKSAVPFRITTMNGVFPQNVDSALLPLTSLTIGSFSNSTSGGLDCPSVVLNSGASITIPASSDCRGKVATLITCSGSGTLDGKVFSTTGVANVAYNETSNGNITLVATSQLTIYKIVTYAMAVANAGESGWSIGAPTIEEQVMRLCSGEYPMSLRNLLKISRPLQRVDGTGWIKSPLYQLDPEQINILTIVFLSFVGVRGGMDYLYKVDTRQDDSRCVYIARGSPMLDTECDNVLFGGFEFFDSSSTATMLVKHPYYSSESFHSIRTVGGNTLDPINEISRIWGVYQNSTESFDSKFVTQMVNVSEDFSVVHYLGPPVFRASSCAIGTPL